jgi:hypothetical protein
MPKRTAQPAPVAAPVADLIENEGRDMPQFVGKLVSEFADRHLVGRDLFLALLFVLYELLGELEGVVEIGAEFLAANASFSCFSR